MHAEVLATAAGWGMLHKPGADTLAEAERAVEYARLVRAEEIELNVRLTLGGLMVDSGSADEGLAMMRDVIDRSLDLGLVTEAGRGHVNLASSLESVGRSADAVRIAEEGVELAQKYGLLDNEAWVQANRAESLFNLGRWVEALDCMERVERTAVSTKPLGNARMRRADLALLRGELETGGRLLAEAHAAFGSYDPMAQHAIPLARIALGIAAAQGRIADARAELARAVDPGFPPGTQRYAWPLLAAAASVEADVRGLPSAEAGRAAALELIRSAAKRSPRPCPGARRTPWSSPPNWTGPRARTGGPLGGGRRRPPAPGPPYELARACQRWAAALLAEGGDRETVSPRCSARPAPRPYASAPGPWATAGTPARRARVPLTIPDAALPDEPADPAEALGLTSREQDVLRLVAAGHSNRQIAEELYISPKTASVHVSNILAKLGVSGRGEAAALAHRLNLFPARQAIRAAP